MANRETSMNSRAIKEELVKPRARSTAQRTTSNRRNTTRRASEGKQASELAQRGLESKPPPSKCRAPCAVPDQAARGDETAISDHSPAIRSMPAFHSSARLHGAYDEYSGRCRMRQEKSKASRAVRERRVGEGGSAPRPAPPHTVAWGSCRYRRMCLSQHRNEKV
jgi:hypothetical protein